MPNDEQVQKPSVYPGKFVFDDGKPLKDVYVYTDVPGDNQFDLANKWKTNERGTAGRLLANHKYNFYFSKEERDKAWLKKNISEAACKLVETGAAQEGVIKVEIKRPKFEVELNMSKDPKAAYLGWAPSKSQLKQTDGDPVATVELRCKESEEGGKLSFYDNAKGEGGPADTKTVKIESYQAATTFWVGGKAGHASTKDKDTTLELVWLGEVLVSVPLMIRVRKNANTLTDDERKAFVQAFADLNDAGNGPFKAFRDMHTNESDPQAHGGVQFLLWHRAFILALERGLQTKNPAVSLHYWRFDEAAPKLFDKNFIGETKEGQARPTFAADNPLKAWKTDNDVGILRESRFDTKARGASGNGSWPTAGRVRTEAETLALGSSFSSFAGMEGDPHGAAHVSFSGYLQSIGTAAKDPLFFMLHCNVDRLWALWQKNNKKYKESDYTSAFSSRTRKGHKLDDTMWPWDGDTANGRPSTAPGGAFPEVAHTEFPGGTPKVKQMIDYQGRESDGVSRLGFDYDTVTFA